MEKYEKSYKEFELPLSDIQEYFEYIIKKHEVITNKIK